MVIKRILLCSLTGLALQAQSPAEFFESKVRPLLAQKCYSCHTASALGGLRLDSRDSMLKGGKSGPAIVPGKADESLLLRAVLQSDDKLKMPMAGERLSAQEVADLRRWIQAGAMWPEPAAAVVAKKGFSISAEQRAFWSLQPLRQPSQPTVRNQSWAKTAIDRFILAKLEEKQLRPAPAAGKRELLRRVYYDLIGLPPTPEQVEAFVADGSPDAFARVVDRLLESKHYGERWGRHWLDVARYADGGGKDKRPVFLGYGMARDGYVNTWRYRDWVIDAFNRDLPYDQFVKAQIAADLLPEKDREAMLPALGFFGLGPWFTGDDVIFPEARANERDDKIDALTKGFLGLTVTCARCHDHKYDPISQKDYYSLAGVFWSSGYHEYPLEDARRVDGYRAHWNKVKELQAAIESFAGDCTLSTAETLAGQSARYMMAGRKALIASPRPDLKKLAEEEKLDAPTLARWMKYLAEPAARQHPYLKEWDAAMKGSNDQEAQRLAMRFQELVLSVIKEKKTILAANTERVKTYLPDPNEATVELPGDLRQFEFFQYKQLLVQKVMETHRHYVWLDVVQGEASPDYPKRDAIFENSGKQLLRLLSTEQRAKLDAMQAELAALEKASPPEYPYLMGLSDNAQPANVKLALRGNVQTPGDEVPRGLPAILAGEGNDPKPFVNGSGRLELAESVARHPLTARVIANRIWMNHFGRGIVASPSNFGVMGERPSHPELLEYLASRLIANHWSIKALHREIVLSSVYQLSSKPDAANQSADPGNVLLWRSNFRRLDAEAIRDSLLFVSGGLDERIGGPPQEINDGANKKRTVYARIRRTGGEGILGLFDFPDPTLSGDQRAVTNVPLQGLFFLNSDLMWREAGRLAERLKAEAPDDAGRIQRAYRLLYGRQASERELRRGLSFLNGAQNGWQQYAQALLSSGEFLYLN